MNVFGQCINRCRVGGAQPDEVPKRTERNDAKVQVEKVEKVGLGGGVLPYLYMCIICNIKKQPQQIITTRVLVARGGRETKIQQRRQHTQGREKRRPTT